MRDTDEIQPKIGTAAVLKLIASISLCEHRGDISEALTAFCENLNGFYDGVGEDDEPREKHDLELIHDYCTYYFPDEGADASVYKITDADLNEDFKV